MYSLSLYTDSAEILVDTTNAYKNDSIRYSLNDDTLRLFRSYIDTNDTIRAPFGIVFPVIFDSILVAFVPLKDSVSSIVIFESISSTYSDIGEVFNSKIYSLSISSLALDSESIFVLDSSFQAHHLEFSIVEVDSEQFLEPYYQNDYRNIDFTASSVSLSGVFLPTTFFNPARVEVAPSQSILGIHSSNGSIACLFDVSYHARNLEIYSLLGIREWHFAISPGQTEASLPHLPAGFYFIRLGGAVAKIYIND